MQDRIKIVYLVSRFPFPLIKGDKLRAFHQIKELSKTVDVYLIALSDENVRASDIEALKPYCKDIKVFGLNWFTITINCLKFFLFSKKPIQAGYFYSDKNKRRFDRELSVIKPDHIIFQLIRTVEYSKGINGIPKTLDYMDALSAGMKRRAEHSNKFIRWVFRLEANRLKKYEHNVYRFFNNTSIISESDRSLIFHYENEDINVIPNGINTEYFHPIEKEIEYDLLFTGNMSYPPNVQSAIYLVEEIMPLVWKERSDVKLLISGANPIPKIKALASDKIIVKGWVDDIRDSYSKSKLFVAPMLIGSGLQNKILEAMSMKMPCVSSELANRSLKAIHGDSILIGEEPQEYASLINFLLENDEKAKELAEKGHYFVASNFSWSKSNKKLLQLIQDGRT